jgi:hypothetical protein
MSQQSENIVERSSSGPWTDLGLTLPIFVGYHLGVIFLPVRNGADWVTQELVALADNNMGAYGLLTLGIAAVYVSILVVAGRGQVFRWPKFALLGMEAIVYAIAMKLLASYVVLRVYLGPSPDASLGVFSGAVLSFGAGFYEEVAFRVGLYGLGFKAIQVLFPLAPWQRPLVALGWAIAGAALFSLWHYLGPMGDPLDGRSFLFRLVCGLFFTLIYAFRGFAPVVWTHTLYDVWVLAL